MADGQMWTFLVAITLLTVTPGIDTVLVIRNTVRGGWRDGAVSSLGICSGLFAHATVSAVGISMILMQSAWAFSALKLAGAGYLIWLGIASLRRAARPHGGLDFGAGRSTHNRFDAVRALREGFLSNVLNPKTVVFYMAFLPQFIDPTQPALRQALWLAAIHFVIAMLWQCLLAGMVLQARAWLSRPRVGRAFDGLTGSVMTLLGLSLVVGR